MEGADLARIAPCPGCGKPVRQFGGKGDWYCEECLKANVVGKIIDGVVVEVRLDPPEHMPPTLSAITRTKRRLSIQSCTACPLHESRTQAVPFTYPEPRAPVPFAVVGEGPGPDEDRRGEPFVGASGKLLRAMMNDVGLPEPAFLNVVSCFPNNGGRIRQPSKLEIEACNGHLMGQLEALDVEYVLLVGAVALGQWRSDLTVTETHGQVFVWMRRWAIMPVMHPAAILRTKSAPMRAELRADLTRFSDMIGSGVSGIERLGDQCVKCGGYVTHYDNEGVPWCDKDFGRYEVKAEKARGKLGKRDVVGQERFGY